MGIGIISILLFMLLVGIALLSTWLEKREKRSSREEVLRPFKEIREEAFGSVPETEHEDYELSNSGEVVLESGKRIMYNDFLWTGNLFDSTACELVMRSKDGRQNYVPLTKNELEDFISKAKRLPDKYNCFVVDERVVNMSRFYCSTMHQFCSWDLIFQGETPESKYIVEIINPIHDELWLKCATRKDGAQFATLPGTRYPCNRGRIIGMDRFVRKGHDMGECLLYFQTSDDDPNSVCCRCSLTPKEERDFDNSVAMRSRSGKAAHFAETLVQNAVDQICSQ